MQAGHTSAEQFLALFGGVFDAELRCRRIVIAQPREQIESQLRTVELPRIDETLAVLATAAAGR